MFNFFDKSDSQIREDVLNELKWDPGLTSTQVSVDAKDGVVTLRGSVPHYFEKKTAEDAAQRIGGVRAVADEIEVNLLGSYERTDSDIARVALDALSWNYSVPDGVKVNVDNGWLTLTGEAEWDYERNAAEDAVSGLMGVRGVTNKLTLKPCVQPSDVKTRITDALKRSAGNEGGKIEVKVNGSDVTLSGNVNSLADVEDARMAAWNAPGVMRVDNNLKVAH